MPAAPVMYTEPASTAPSTVGTLVRTLREARGLSSNALARRSGINAQTIRNWETEKFAPRLPELELVLTALQASAAQSQQAVEMLYRPRAVMQVRRRIAASDGSGSPDLYGQITPGDLLRAMRVQRGQSLEEVAVKIGIVTRTLSRWERGEIAPDLKQLLSVCRALDASAEEITLLNMSAAAVGMGGQTDTTTLEELRTLFHALPTTEEADRWELICLSLAVRLQPRAWQDKAAREMLAQVYAKLSQNRRSTDNRHKRRAGRKPNE